MDRTRGQIGPLYRRLPHGPNGMGREAVARNQRARLYGGMIESVAQRGYQATTVAHVIGLAGVSRRAFYELFANKEQCFLGSYDIVIASTHRLMLEAWASERGWANRLHSACRALLDETAQSPNGPRLVLVEALGVGVRARERLHLAGLTFERLVAAAFEASPHQIGFPRMIPRALVGGVRHLAFVRLLCERERELLSMTDEVLDWVEAYRTPAAARLDSVGSVRPPRMPPASACFLVREDRRAKLLGSLVHLTLDSGYPGLSDPQIAQFAGLSTEAFHREFATKEACFLAVLEEFVLELEQWVRARMGAGPRWPQTAYAGVAAFVEYLAAHEALLRIAFIHAFEVGPAVVGQMTGAVDGLTALLTESGPEPMRGPAIAREAIAGALWSIVATSVVGNGIARLPALVDQLAFLVLAPYVGPKVAVATIASMH
jgi:AcrR family transcriptional regulator